jgi:hypothetical protein
MSASRLLALAAALLALSCDPGGASSDILQACKDYGYAYCTRLEACSPTATQERFGSTATCESLEVSSCVDALIAPSTGATAAGREACTSALPEWACSDFIYSQNPPPACAPPTGALPDGAACAVLAQCQSGYCGYPTGVACGTCAPAPQPGDSCAEIQCPSGLTCEASACVAYGQVGAACTSTAPCNEGLSCTAGTCEVGVTMVGATCSFTGAGCDFFGGLVCDAETGKCVTAKLAGPGQACGLVAGQQISCVTGSCTRGVCIADVPVGGACEIGQSGAPSCISSSRCTVSVAGGTSGTCQQSGSSACQ